MPRPGETLKYPCEGRQLRGACTTSASFCYTLCSYMADWQKKPSQAVGSPPHRDVHLCPAMAKGASGAKCLLFIALCCCCVAQERLPSLPRAASLEGQQVHVSFPLAGTQSFVPTRPGGARGAASAWARCLLLSDCSQPRFCGSSLVKALQVDAAGVGGKSQASPCSVGDEGTIPRGYKDGDCLSSAPHQQPAALSTVPVSEMLAQEHGPEYSFLLPVGARSVLGPTAPPCCTSTGAPRPDLPSSPSKKHLGSSRRDKAGTQASAPFVKKQFLSSAT